jgi:hypothetical protein
MDQCGMTRTDDFGVYGKGQTASSPLSALLGSDMTLARTTPRLGALPELETYRCHVCGEVTTVEREGA